MTRLFEWAIHKGVDEKDIKRRLTSKKLADKEGLSGEDFPISDISLSMFQFKSSIGILAI